MESTAIIVAAGVGKRMNSETKKQYMDIAGLPVLYYTLKAFEESSIDNIIIVTGAEEIDYVRTGIVRKYEIKKIAAIIPGGKERFDSVFEGMKYLKDSTSVGWQKNCIVLVHDGVRPLVTPKLINTVITTAKETGACVAAVPVKDTIKETDSDGVILATLDRRGLRQIQTPQGFEFNLLYGAYEQMYKALEKAPGSPADNADYELTTVLGPDGMRRHEMSVTDDSMLVELYTGHSVQCVMGDYNNIKITTPEDITYAGMFLDSSED